MEREFTIKLSKGHYDALMIIISEAYPYADAIKALEFLIGEMREDKLRVVHVKMSNPAIEVSPRDGAHKAFEPGPDIYIGLHFARRTE